MKTLFALALAGAVLVSFPAAATNNCSNAANKKLKFFSYDTAEIVWQSNRVDSPLDSNKSRLMIHVLLQDGIPPYDYAGAYNDCTGIEGKSVEQVKNLSFDFLNTSSQPVHSGAGSPRISVELDKGGDGGGTDLVAYLAGFHCEAVLPEDIRWSRADFTGRVSAGCSIYTSEGGPHTSDGVSSAWAVFAAAYPGAKVVDAYLVADEDAVGTGATSFVDRLAFQNRMFVASGSGSAAIKNCSSESSC
jgi:hypothetical protein